MSTLLAESSRRCNYLVDLQLWPRQAAVSASQWLTNFRTEEFPLAKRLLEGVTYFSGELVRQMFRGAFANISQYVVSNKSSYIAANMEWERFLGTVLIVRVTGEKPSETDSGYLFSRLARDHLGISESQIVSPEFALRSLVSNSKRPIVFVDDFVGSGSQFEKTWTRLYDVGAGIEFSFSSLTSGGSAHGAMFYVAVICTEKGRRLTNLIAPSVQVVPAHEIGDQYSAISDRSIIWRKDMQSEGPDFVRRKSLEIGIPDLDGQVGCWRGFCKLGLAIWFEHGWPDATLPLFHYDKNGWKPLMRKGL